MNIDHSEKNYATEEKFKEECISLVEDRFPGCIYYMVRRYTEKDKTTKPLQDAHIDCIVLWRGKIYLIDFKCVNSDTGYCDCAILEIYRQYEENHKLKSITEGWIKSSGVVYVPDELLLEMPEELRKVISANGNILDVDSDRQYIIRITDNEAIVFRKDNIRRVKYNHLTEYNYKNLVREKDSGNKSENVANGNIKWDYNKYYYYDKPEDVAELDEMEAIMLHKKRKPNTIGGCYWEKVTIKDYSSRS